MEQWLRVPGNTVETAGKDGMTLIHAAAVFGEAAMLQQLVQRNLVLLQRILVASLFATVTAFWLVGTV